MANDQGILYGARPLTAPDGPPKLFYWPANTANAIYRGQFVAVNNSGQVQVIAPGDNVASRGIAWSFTDADRAGLPSGMNSLTQGAFLPSGQNGFVGVTYDPQQLYVMEEITGGTAITALSVGLLTNWTYIGTSTGNTNTGLATTVIQNSSVAGGTGPLLEIMGLYDITNQDGTQNAVGASAKWVVRIANHQNNGTKLSVAQG